MVSHPRSLQARKRLCPAINSYPERGLSITITGLISPCSLILSTKSSRFVSSVPAFKSLRVLSADTVIAVSGISTVSKFDTSLPKAAVRENLLFCNTWWPSRRVVLFCLKRSTGPRPPAAGGPAPPMSCNGRRRTYAAAGMSPPVGVRGRLRAPMTLGRRCGSCKHVRGQRPPPE